MSVEISRMGVVRFFYAVIYREKMRSVDHDPKTRGEISVSRDDCVTAFPTPF